LRVDTYFVKPFRESAVLQGMENLLAPTEDVREEITSPSVADAGRSLRVLVAEDNPVNQMFACWLLEQNGHQAVVANSGTEALSLATAQQFDAALMDLEMPDMDGFATTAAIRNHEKETGTYLPIIALTAHALAGFEERCRDVG